MTNSCRKLLASAFSLAVIAGGMALSAPAQAASSPGPAMTQASQHGAPELTLTVTSPTNGSSVANSQITITGTARPGSEIAIGKGDSPWVGGTYYGEQLADDEGKWSFTTPKEHVFAEGEHRFWVMGVDWSADAEDQFTTPITVTVVVPKTTPPAPKPDTTLTVTSMADGSTVPGPTLTISGTGRPGTVVMITPKGSPHLFGYGFVDAQGKWSVTNAATSPLAPGKHQLLLKGQGEERVLSFTVSP